MINSIKNFISKFFNKKRVDESSNNKNAERATKEFIRAMVSGKRLLNDLMGYSAEIMAGMMVGKTFSKTVVKNPDIDKDIENIMTNLEKKSAEFIGEVKKVSNISPEDLIIKDKRKWYSILDTLEQTKEFITSHIHDIRLNVIDDDKNPDITDTMRKLAPKALEILTKTVNSYSTLIKTMQLALLKTVKGEDGRNSLPSPDEY